MAKTTPRTKDIAINTPPGVMFDYAGASAPSGWLFCNGAVVSRTTYSVLFAAISTAYGVGDGTTTFALPDFRGRFARYNDNMGGTGAASRDTGRVHGSTQTQTTAKNGLTATSTVSGTNSASSLNVITTFPGTYAATHGAVYGANINGTLLSADAQSWSGTASTTISGDAETRPINLSCNKIIKI